MDLPIPNETANRKKILLAEDDASMRRLLEVMLTKAEYDVSAAEDGVAALRLTSDGAFDAVVADAIMPGMSGYDLCRAVAHGRIPCIILSGLDQSGPADGVATVFLTKDENLKDNLLSALERVLG